MKLKNKKWTYFNTFIFASVLLTISMCLARTLYDDIILPIFIERNEYAPGTHRSLSLARKIQVILGDMSDMMIGIALLYLCYNNARFALKKKKRKHRRFMR